MPAFYECLISGGCGAAAAWFISSLHKKSARREEVEGKSFAAVIEKRISDLEFSSKTHGAMLAAVKTLAQSVERLSVDIKEMTASNAAQNQAIINLSRYTADLREDIGEVRRDLKEHLREKHS